MSYELKQEDIFSLCRSLGETKEKGKELFLKYCPYCNGGEHKDKDTFSINTETGAFSCFRSSCNAKGHFVELARDFNFPLDNGFQKQYRKLPQKTPKPTNKAFEYLASRNISAEIVERYHITTANKQPNILCFPFYDENNVLQFIKNRNTAFKQGVHKSKEWVALTDCKQILFGMAQVKNFGTLVITEGQIDSLSVSECGFNAVSVPTGCNGFTWLPHCYDWLLKFEKIIVFGDFENGRMSLIDTLRNRLNKPLFTVQEKYYLGEKDANAIICKYGRDSVIKAIENAIIEPVKCVKELADVENVDIYSRPRIRTCIPEIDKTCGGLIFSTVTLLSGKRGEGKSTFMSQLIANALEQDYPTFIYSGELQDFYFKRWLDLQIAGIEHIETSVNEFGDYSYFLSQTTIETINNWYRGKAYIFDNSAVGSDEYDGLLQIIERTVCRYGIKLVCIDNLMTALDVDVGSDLYRSQANFVKHLAHIAKQYDIAIILVAHPKKSKDGFDNDTVSGASEITNLVDLVLNYERNTDKETQSDYDSIAMITKNRLNGKLIISKDDSIKLQYSPASKRIRSVVDNTNHEYGCFKSAVTSENQSSDIPFWED